MTKKNEWEIERDMADALRENACKSFNFRPIKCN
jgi:hypothetical protein